MATPQFLDVKTDADYVALRRRMSRLRVQNSTHTNDDDDDDDELTDEMLRDLIKYWKKNNTDIAKRFIQTRKERKAKEKASHTVSGTSGRRKSIEFEDLERTKNGLRLHVHEPLHTVNRPLTRVSEADVTGSDEVLSVRRAKKTANEQKMHMIMNRASSKTDMSKAEEQIIKSKLGSVSKTSPPLQRANSSMTFRSRTGSGSSKDMKKKHLSDSESFRKRSDSGSFQHPKDRTDSETFRQRSYSSSSKSPPENRKLGSTKRLVSKQTSVPLSEVP